MLVWGDPRSEHLNSAFALQRHSAPTAGVMVWGVIVYNTRSPLVFIRGRMLAQRYVHDILQPHVLPLMRRISGALFQQDKLNNFQQDRCYNTVSCLLLPLLDLPNLQICLQSIISGIIWDSELGIPRV
ncbi:uncharacterized protein TNCV_1771671 [Trichonephila clavipes]|nr:uncharacterized protein TNCV_1771671 [Trichonephila clavipes]